MKKIYALLLFSIAASSIIAQPIVHVEVNIKNHLNDANNITGCILEPDDDPYKMYVHSGICSSTTQGVPSPEDCQNPDFVWEHVVGDWGMDNGHGLMQEIADSVWALDIDVATFYSNEATISQNGQSGEDPSTTLPEGATVYSMGFVFRDHDGTIGGKTGGCTDFFIFDLDQGNTSVDVGLPGNTLPDSTFNVSQVTSINEVVSISFRNTYPNPFKDQVKIIFDQQNQDELVDIKVFNAKGQVVKQLYHGYSNYGMNAVVWDGLDNNGVIAAPGIYYYTMQNGNKNITEKLIKTN